MLPISITYPRKVLFGCGVIKNFIEDINTSYNKLFILTIKALYNQVDRICNSLIASYKIEILNDNEPRYSDFYNLQNVILKFRPNIVVGIGGGSVLDMVKLLSAFTNESINLKDYEGKNKILQRTTKLICIPTTAGTGSEMSPNAILKDDDSGLKNAFISDVLVPDSVYIDPELTLTLPPTVTAYTGFDALTHCIEAFVNKNAHPIIDLYALEGIKLAIQNILPAVKENRLEARENMAIASMYGGICLGPVNTAAVHALAYPLGNLYNIPHGLANAILLPEVIAYNISKGYERRYAKISYYIGFNRHNGDQVAARYFLSYIKELQIRCGIPQRLSELNIIPETDLLAKQAFMMQRLLQNNVVELFIDDIKKIYENVI